MKAPVVLGSLLALAGTVATAERADAATVDIKEELREAVCFQDWYKAIEISSSLIASPKITPNDRQTLLNWRRQFYTYAKGDPQTNKILNCKGVKAPPRQFQSASPAPRFSTNTAAVSSRTIATTPSSPLHTLADLWTVGVRVEGNNIKGTVFNNGITTANNVTLTIRSQQEGQTENIRTVAIETVQAWGETDFVAAFNNAPGDWTIERIEVN